MKRIVYIVVVQLLGLIAFTQLSVMPVHAAQNPGFPTKPLFRTCNPRGYHFYTTDANELRKLRDTYEQVLEGFEGHLAVSQVPGSVPLFRLYNANDHLYTTSSDEVASATKCCGFKLEGPIGFIATTQQPGTTPLYRHYHPALGSHFYTTSKGESDAIKNDWKLEGIAGYVWTVPTSGVIEEEFYANQSQQSWQVMVSWDFLNGKAGGGASIPQSWHRRDYRIGPPGYKMSSYKATETTKNNDAMWADSEAGGFHVISLAVEDRALFGASNWVGVLVHYELSRSY